MTPNHVQSNAFRVKVGHAELLVRADSEAEAIARARRQLAAELPRLYDVIRALDADRFEVRPAA